MDSVGAFVERVAADIACRSTTLGRRIIVDSSVLDRSESVALGAPGRQSANGSCRLLRARDGWIAVNLPREDDVEAVPALLSTEPDADYWGLLERKAGKTAAAELASRGETLGLAIARVGERSEEQACVIRHHGQRTSASKLRVVDLSSLWAGPLCGSILATFGADVIKIESVERPDSTQVTSPEWDQRLNGAKKRQRLALSTAEGAADLLGAVQASDILITSSRARALKSLGLEPDTLFAANPSLIWVAITGHGWGSNRIAFGDDAAAAGNLVSWLDGEPVFVGDALADPLTGLMAADAVLGALECKRGAFIDAALAGCAAFAAAGLGARP